ncbi:hypothetical protein SKDZ_09G1500 [Saccharomyces kudriavzevii ZP591]|nr:hypothetical protein SKDZ_09G1500 [Saccharomyces kudriavzevii ZP591]
MSHKRGVTIGLKRGRLEDPVCICVRYTASTVGLFLEASCCFFNVFLYAVREWSVCCQARNLVQSSFLLNEARPPALYHPYEKFALNDAYFALREKVFLVSEVTRRQ